MSDEDTRLELLQGTLDLLILRTLKRGWIAAEDGSSENNRRARWARLAGAIARILHPQTERAS